jgi:hypothetical protein
MRLPRVRFTVRQMMLAVAIIGLIFGTREAADRRSVRLALAAQSEDAEFSCRGAARREALIADLYEHPPKTERELRWAEEEIHPLPGGGCIVFHTSFAKLEALGPEGRRIRAQRFRECSEEHSRSATIYRSEWRSHEAAALLPWQRPAVERPLPTLEEHARWCRGGAKLLGRSVEPPLSIESIQLLMKPRAEGASITSPRTWLPALRRTSGL